MMDKVQKPILCEGYALATQTAINKYVMDILMYSVCTSGLLTFKWHLQAVLLKTKNILHVCEMFHIDQYVRVL
jgi:hypothetical protein